MLTEEIRNLIGKSTSAKTYEIEKGAIRRFADAVGDPNPLYRDEEYARNSRYGSVIAPPGFFGWPVEQDRDSAIIIDIPPELVTVLGQAGYPFSSVVDGGIEYEFFLPIRAGDVLTAKTTVRNIRERAGSTGSIVLIILETTYLNQNSNLVTTAQVTAILRSLNQQQKEQTNA
ncbi:MAG: MaoC family dehydratase N-terminal domain-containing protein [Chloroflexi bacterium]|nr:MaoC family dehydratase N-terminal domain-containing protein [Chloroflexota bacterium]